MLRDNAFIASALAAPDYLDHQGAGAVTMTVSFNAILRRLIMANQSPGIWNAIGKFQLPKPKIIVSLLFG